MAEIQIRTARTTDLPILLEFEQGIITAERPYDKTLKAGHINYYDIGELILSDNSEVIVAVNTEEIVGSAYVKIKTALPYLDHADYAYLGFMFVKPEYRGRGINMLIIEALNEWAKSKGITEIRLDVYADNVSALRAYEKADFKPHLVNMRMRIE
jgi:GNAT superfamily N-acetyltransferase